MGNQRVEMDNYDRGIVPAEVKERIEREGENYKQIPEQEGQSKESIDTTGGYTMSREGLLNNYAIEPEMYVETPGDLRDHTEQDKASRESELHAINETEEDGKLTMEGDRRGRGPGVI